ncbi:MAG: LLM class flavin-dependent oxidoreductase [Candidatus Binataceae bacterium]|nr:LLM class flavin-dependent oxidoreductase [Candidatus Binataceae bacterium]
MANELKFGVYCEIQNGYGVDYAKNIWDVFRLIEHADQLGYDVFSVIEHHFFQEFSISANPMALFAAAAQKTRNIRFRTLCHTLPLRNPVVHAGELAFADIMTDGRLDVGVGRGHAWEYVPAGIPMEETQGRYEESLEILELAWTKERFSYHGKYYQLEDVSVVPKPLQKPYPPVFMVGTSGAAFEIGARKGWALAFGGPAPVAAFKPGVDRYREACAKYGTKAKVACVRAVYITEDERQARAECETAIKKFFSYNATALPSIRTGAAMKQRLLDSNYAFYASEIMETLSKLTYEQILAEDYAFVGTPAQVLDQCIALQKTIPVDEILIIPHYGDIEAWKAERTQALFASEVMPKLRRA